MPDTLEHDLEGYFGALADRVDRGVDEPGQSRQLGGGRGRWIAMAAACLVLVAGAAAIAFWPVDDATDTGPVLTDTSVAPTETTVPDEETSDATEPAPLQTEGSWAPIDAPGIGGQEETPSVVWMLTDFLVLDTVNGGYTPTAARVDPVTGQAVAVPDPPGNWRYAPTVVWTGREVVMLAGSSGRGLGVFGAAYDPMTDQWREIDGPPGVDAATSAPFESLGVWNGSEVVFWADRWAYEPRSDTWREIASSPLTPRAYAASVAIGRDIFVWGGCDPVHECDLENETWLSDGAIWSAEADEWTVVPDGPLHGSPSPTAVSDGDGATVATRYDHGDGRVARFVPGDGWTELPRPAGALQLQSVLTQVGRSVTIIGPSQALVLHPGAAQWRQIPTPSVFRAVGDGGGHLLATGNTAPGPHHPELIAVDDAWVPIQPETIDIEIRVEVRDGATFSEYTTPELPPGSAYVSLWLDGRLWSRGSAIAGSTGGSTLGDLLDAGPIEAQLVVEDIDMYPIAATDPVELTSP